MKRKIILMIYVSACLLLTGTAQAIEAERCPEGICVTWPKEYSGCGVLTLYRDGWPIVVLDVDYDAGSYTISSGYARKAGRYEVRLKAGGGCERVAVQGDVAKPTEAPTATPTAVPTVEPTATPTAIPTEAPTAIPTVEPTATPTAIPTEAPTAIPTVEPTAVPTAIPTVEPTEAPTVIPTVEPTEAPTAIPTVEPTEAPTAIPTVEPTEAPTVIPTVEPTAEPTVAPTAEPEVSMAERVIELVNQERVSAGLNELEEDSDLTEAACVRAREIVRQFSHTRPDGSSWSTVSAKAFGENIAMGYRTPDEVMDGWMNSQGHRENILRESFESIGVCAWEENGRIYWVQLFGR